MDNSNGYTKVSQSLMVRSYANYIAMRDECLAAIEEATEEMLADKQYTVGVLWLKRKATKEEALDIYVGGSSWYKRFTVRKLLVKHGYLTLDQRWKDKLLDKKLWGKWSAIAEQVEVHACLQGAAYLNTQQCDFVRTFAKVTNDES